MTQQLSPIAQAVQFAAFRVYDEEELLYVVPAEKHAGMVAAAALRAAAENFLMDWDAIQCCDFLLDMADELEAQ
jgi:hypothetical protein